jgi:hypothetical protein
MRQHDEPQDLSPAAIEQLRGLVHALAVRPASMVPQRTSQAVANLASATSQVDPDPLIEQALHLVYENHLIIPFDWSNWDEGRAILNSDNPNRFATLDRLTILKLLTVVARDDRFAPGAWSALFDRGDGPNLLHRLLDLETSPPDLV